MNKYRIEYPAHCLHYLDLIQSWFLENFGFAPVHKDVVKFVIHTTNNSYNNVLKKTIRNKLMFAENHSFTVTEEGYAKVNSIYLQNSDAYVTIGNCLACLCASRYLSLPLKT